MRRMRAAILTAPKMPLTVADDVTIDDPRPGEALVRITHCGLCHSDLSIIDGDMPYPVPAVLGHEATGEVVALGPGTTGFAAGDRVVLSMRAPCDECFYCRRGQPVLCERGAVPPGGGEARLWRQGQPLARGFQLAAFAEYAVVPVAGLAPVPDALPPEQAAVLGCAVQTGMGSVVNVAGCGAEDCACVIGLGGVGLAMVMALRAQGATRIAGIDPMPERRARAEALGAAFTLPPGEGAAAVTRLTEGRGFDAVFDNVATTGTTAEGLSLTRKGGQLVLVGVTGRPQAPGFTTMDLVMSQRQVKGAFLGNCHPRHDLPRMAAAAVEGRLDLAALVTGRVPLGAINQALDGMRRGEGVRTIIDMQAQDPAGGPAAP